VKAETGPHRARVAAALLVGGFVVAACNAAPTAPGLAAAKQPATATTTTIRTPLSGGSGAPPRICGAARTGLDSTQSLATATAITPAAAGTIAKSVAAQAIADPNIPGTAGSVPVVVTSVDAYGAPQVQQVVAATPSGADTSVQQASADVVANGGSVVAVEPARTLSVAVTSMTSAVPVTPAPANDTYRSQQWALDTLGVEHTWATTTGAGVCVAVLDTGILTTHPDLAGQVVGGVDETGSGSMSDVYGHGTHVAGIIAALANNHRGVAGAAPGAKLLDVKVMADNGTGYDTWVAQGIIWAVDHNAQVLNLSLGASCPQWNSSLCTSSAIQSALAYAQQHGVVVVAAGGNDGLQVGTDNWSWPAAYGSPIAVAATTESNGRASFSTKAPYLTVAAPGQDILSTYLGPGYAWMSGTSMATPYVTATVALMLASNPTETPTQVKARLEGTALDLGSPGFDQSFGYGLIQPSLAVG
jgi:serine protease